MGGLQGIWEDEAAQGSGTWQIESRPCVWFIAMTRIKMKYDEVIAITRVTAQVVVIATVIVIEIMII